MNSAQVWARTMLGDGERMHGIVGYYNGAPSGDIHENRLTDFFLYSINHNYAIVDAWAQAHTRVIGSNGWAALYHEENENDTFLSMAECSANGEPYTIYYIGRDIDDFALPLNTSEYTATDLSVKANAVANANAYPVYLSVANTASNNNYTANAIYARLQEQLPAVQNSLLRINSNGQITYSVGTRNWGDEALGYHLTDAEAISFAKQQLNILGLMPQCDYRATVSKVNRYEINLSGGQNTTPETIEYTVTFYRLFNGIDVISNQEDGIMVSFNKNGLTELRYLWREMEIATECKAPESGVLTLFQAQALCRDAGISQNQISTDDTICNGEYQNATVAYLQIDNEVRPVYVFASDDCYTNCTFVDMVTGDILSIG